MKIFKQDPTLPQGFSDTFRKRFWAKVDKNGPIPNHMPHLGKCWVWTGAKNNKGYGVMNRGQHSGNILAQRASWLLNMGMPIDCVLHRCDNPECVNPDHLWHGSRAENMKDMAVKGRWNLSGARKPVVPKHGTDHPLHKLNENQVREIRRDHKAGIVTAVELARRYGVSDMLIFKVVHSKSWKHVTDS